MARDLKLQVVLDAVDRVTRPLKKISQGSGRTAEALRANKEQLRDLNRQQKDVTAYRQARVAMRGNQRAIRELTDQAEQYTRQQAEQQDRHERTQSDLKSARREYDRLANAVASATEPNAQLSAELDKARIRLEDQQAAADRSGNELKRYRERIRQTNGKVERLNATQRTHQERLSGLKRRLEDAGIGTDQLGRKARELRGQEQRLSDSLEQQQARLRAVTAQQKRLTDARERYQRTASRASSMAGSGAAGAAAGGAALTAMTHQAFSNQMSGARLAAQFGEGDQEATRYREVITQVYRGGRGEGLDQVEQAVGAIGASFGSLDDVSNKTLAEITSQALALSDVFGIDIAEAAQTAGIMVQNGLADNASAAFDLMGRSFQQVPEQMRQELPEILHEYSTNFRALGFDGQEAMGLLVAAAEQGKFALDKTGDSLKEFTIRGSDMSKASREAYEAVGLDAQAMSDAIAGGGDARQAMHTTARAILAIEDPARRANTAIALFGTPLEDLSVDQIPQFLQALTGAQGGLGDVTGAVDDMAATLDDNAGKALQRVQRVIAGEFMGVLDDVDDEIIAVARAVTNWIDENPELARTLVTVTAGLAALVAVGGTLTAVLGAIIGPIAMVNVALGFLAANPVVLTIMGIVAAVAALAAGAYLIYRNWEAIGGWFGERWQQIKDAFAGGIGSVTRLLLDWSPIGLIWRGVTAGLDALGVEIPQKFGSLGSAMIDGLIGGIAGMVGGLIGQLGALWQQIKDAFAGGIGGVNRLLLDWSPLGLLWRGINAGLEAMGVELPEKFSSLGGFIMDGLIGGLTSKLAALRDRVTGIADNVKGWFADVLDIHSPSRVFARLGGHTVDGLNQGLDAQRDEPARRVGEIARRVRQAGAGLAIGTASLPAMAELPALQVQVERPEMPALAAHVQPAELPTAIPAAPTITPTPPVTIDRRPPLQAAGGGDVHITVGDINVHAAPGMDEQALARLVQSEIQRALADASRDAGARRRSAFQDID